VGACVKTILVLLTCLGLCSCAFAPESDSFDEQDYVAAPVAPVVGHQQYVVPLPQGASFQNSAWDVHRYYNIGGSSDSFVPRAFAPPQPPFSY
jgi:hypothetical protein